MANDLANTGPSEQPPSVSRRLIDLAAPIIGLNVLNVLALVVDTAMCGRLPDAEVALAALSFAVQVLFLMMVAMMGLTVGTVAMVARAHGAGDHERVEHVISQATVMTIVLGIGVAVIGNLFGPAMISALGASDAALDVAMDYLRPLLLWQTFNYLMILYGAILRGVGNTRLPFMIAVGSNILNVGLNYCLILGNFGLPQLGVLGAAIGTMAAQCFGTLGLMWAVHRGAIHHVALRAPRRIDRPLIASLVRVGVPAAADMVILNAAFLSIIGMLGRIDEDAVAAHGVGLRIQALAFVPGMSISQATGAMVGNALGAGNVGLARAVLRSSVVLSTVVMTSLAVVIVAFVEPIVAIFDVKHGSDLWTYSIMWIELLGYGMPIVGVYIAFVGLLQGSGKTNVSLRINVIATLAFQIPLSYVLGFTFGLGAWGIWIAFPLAFVIKGSLGYLAYRRGDWAYVGRDV